MRAFIVTALIIGSVLVAAPIAQAVTTDTLDARVQALLSQIEALQKQIVTLMQERAGQTTTAQSSSPVASASACTFTRALRRGMSGEDVRTLQQTLKEANIYAGDVTGYFGPLTEQAVQTFQNAQGIVTSGDSVTTGFGLVGPATRRILWKCSDTGTNTGAMRFEASPTRGPAPLSVTFKTWISGFRAPGHTYTIDFGDGTSEPATNCLAPADACTEPGTNTHTYAQDGVYTAILYHVIDPCSGQVACRAAIHREVAAKTNITVGSVACTKEYMPVCGGKPIVCITTPCDPVPTTYSNKCMMEAGGASFLYAGQCREPVANPANDPQCKVWSDGCNTCSRQTPGSPGMCTLMACQVTDNYAPKPYCKEYFASATTTPNKAPIIASFSGPASLKVGQAGTWSIKATDPEGGQLSYDIMWGDENGNALPTLAFDVARVVTQATSLTHIYYAERTYTIVLTARDDKGATTRSTSTVTVGPTDPTACTMEYAPVCGLKQIQCFTTPCNPILTTYGNTCMLNAAGATFQYTGACLDTTPVPPPVPPDPQNDPTCKLWFDGCNTCSRSTPGGPAMCTMMACMTIGTVSPYCKEHFTNTTPTTNKAPTISSFSGPTTLAVGQSGTWTIKASDPESGALTYDISWGDQSGVATALGYDWMPKTFTQTTSLTHAYSSAGMYTVAMTVFDDKNASAKATATVTVGAAPVACTMQYDPVCGRPAGCANSCPVGMYCAALCQLYPLQTYSNRCVLDAAGAQFEAAGACPTTGFGISL